MVGDWSCVSSIQYNVAIEIYCSWAEANLILVEMDGLAQCPRVQTVLNGIKLQLPTIIEPQIRLCWSKVQSFPNYCLWQVIDG